jgi:hypothetical protein
MPDLRICDRCERDVPLVYAGPLPLTALHLPGWGKYCATCVPEEVRALAKRPREDHDHGC